MKKFIAFLLSIFILAGMCSAMALNEGDARAVIGANLTEEQIRQVYETFNIERDSVKELRVTNDEERQYLDGLVDSSLIGTRAISCVYIEILAEGEGLNVSTSNISWCTKEMYVNALVTAGIDDARVIVTAPFAVSGTAALTGIYKAYEDITGETLDELAKIVGTQELVITAELADEIGSYDAVTIVNELKLILDETKNMTDDELRDTIRELADEYNVSITDGQVDQLIKLCRSLEKLSTDELKSKVESVQEAIKKMAGAKETVNKFVDSAKKIIKAIGNFFNKLLSKLR
ncbi:MAG TPA: DUF1002 domain-containing protein [Clostridiales bacterium]|nr:DUF1002 domain-containing protein [Clostridiales bacterium]